MTQFDIGFYVGMVTAIDEFLYFAPLDPSGVPALNPLLRSKLRAALDKAKAPKVAAA